MGFQEFVRKEMLPLGWCNGCGLHILFYSLCELFDELNKTNTVIVSGIGCTGRGAAYFNLDSVHGLHGRAIPLAVGIKRANPKLDVVVFSGDGDILGIGGNHLIHAARRNENITVICNDNEVFAMTGGQLSPSTRLGGVTTTTPKGSVIQPLNTQGILLSNKKYFYARSSPVFKTHLKKCLRESLSYEGFSLVEVVSPCLVNYSKRAGKGLDEVFKEIKDKFEICEENRTLKDNEFGIVKK
ncbi:MAG: thiamine pyrophosphate-dependent enzyme [Candidatus Woesearchaeota archaeon]